MSKNHRPDIPPNEQFPVVEADLAKDLGVSREEIAELRKKHLTAADCGLGRAGMCLTRLAEEVIRQAVMGPELGDLRLQKNGAEMEAKKDAPQWALPWSKRAVVTLYVKRIPSANPRILICTEDKKLAGENQTVRVKNSANFVRGMDVQVKQRGPALWEFAGNRLPRQKGRY